VVSYIFVPISHYGDIGGDWMFDNQFSIEVGPINFTGTPRIHSYIMSNMRRLYFEYFWSSQWNSYNEYRVDIYVGIDGDNFAKWGPF